MREKGGREDHGINKKLKEILKIKSECIRKTEIVWGLWSLHIFLYFSFYFTNLSFYIFAFKKCVENLSSDCLVLIIETFSCLHAVSSCLRTYPSCLPKSAWYSAVLWDDVLSFFFCHVLTAPWSLVVVLFLVHSFFTKSKSLIYVCVCSVARSCLAICYPMDHSPPGSSAHGIFQARILEWIAIAFSRGSYWPGIEPTPPA